MSRQVTILGTLLGLSLVGSYMRWTAEEGTDLADKIVVLDAKAEQIKAVIWDSEELDLTISWKEDALGRYAMVTAVEQKERKLPSAEPEEAIEDEEGAAEGEEGAAEGESPEPPEAAEEPSEGESAEEPTEPPAPEVELYQEVTEFKAGKAAEELLEDIAPMLAKRALAEVSGDKLAELGLDAPEGTLTVQREGKPDKVYEIGGEAYGTRDRYLRDTETSKVFLIEDKLLRPLKFGPTRLPDRELLGFDAADIATVKVSAVDAEVTYEQRNSDDPKAAYWAAPGEEGEDEEAGNWVNKLLKLKGASFVQAEEIPTGETLELTVVVTGEDGKAVTLEIFKGTDPEGHEAWYATSGWTRSKVKLHTSPASDLAADVETILE
ncbi:MAG: DUF4340 domain-containing protein [Alphaproteobacteria bacterium]|nr:DUF4340 domain-containing protein [Alphaproteobacteria bacterium]